MDELNEKENVQIDNDSTVKEQPTGSYLLGTLGALLGGFIAAIPWILVYIFGEMIFSALAILIAIGALKGYQLFKGRIDKKLPVILTIVSLLVVVVTTLVIIPFAMLAHEGFTLNFEYFKRLYAIEGFWGDITHDLIISIVFTALGISGVISNLNRQIKSSNEETTKSRNNSQPKRTFIIIAIIIVLALVLGFINNTDSDNDTDANTINLEKAQETPYVANHFGMKLVIPQNMAYLTGSNLDYVFGTGASTFYEFAAYRSNALESDMITCFIEDIEKNQIDTYLTSLKNSFVEDGYTVVNDFKEENISGFNFKTIEFQVTSEGVSYNDLCMTHFKDGKLIFIEYSFLSVDHDRVMKNLDNIILENK